MKAVAVVAYYALPAAQTHPTPLNLGTLALAPLQSLEAKAFIHSHGAHNVAVHTCGIYNQFHSISFNRGILQHLLVWTPSREGAKKKRGSHS